MHLILELVVLFFYFQIACFCAFGGIECESSNVAYTITVSKSGGGNFTTITDALNFIPSGNNRWVKISLKPGTYKEQIQIHEDKGCIVLEGSDRTTTTITFDAHSTTSDSITFAAYTDNFVARGVTFKNSFDGTPTINIGPHPKPAVAFRSYGDKHRFDSCGFVGYQDTLWDDKGRHYFHSCYIEGAVDFIWGNGQSVYEQCTINVTGGGFITAQGREAANDTSGYVFRGCNVTGTGQAHLGRAYHAFSRVIFIDSTLDGNVDPQGWFIWNQNGHEKDITYAEVNCTGPGANTSKRVTWEKKLSSSEVGEYSTQNFINQDDKWMAKLPK